MKLSFTVAALYDPKDGRKTGSIKTSTGQYINFWPNDKHLFTIGGEYTADCDPFESNGKTYYTAKGRSVVAKGGAPQGSSAQGASGVSKDETISRLAIAKSCIESGKTQADADSWMSWVNKEKPPVSYPPPEPERVEPDMHDDAGNRDPDLNDPVPF